MFVMVAASFVAACERGAPTTPQESSSAMDEAPAIPIMGPERSILAFGDSLVAGYGLTDRDAYPAKLEAALRARGINARVVNAGISGETTAQGLRRLGDVLDAQAVKPELVVLSLGANDMLQGRPPTEPRANLAQILRMLKDRQIKVLLLGMLAAPALGQNYARDFNAIYPSLAHEHDAALVPFFLQPLLGKPDLVQPDRVHPTALGVEEMVAATADDVAQALPRR